MDLTNAQQFSIGPVTAVDRRGNPASLDGNPTFESDNTAVATVEAHPSGDPSMALVKAVLGASPGAAQIKITADADLGAGVVPLEAFVVANVIPEQAVGLTVPTGPVEDQP
jgi:hypothetical protein